MAALALAVSACGESSYSHEPGDAGTGTQSQTYTVRAQVVTLPADNDGEIRLAHEAIDDFVAVTGEVVGMDAMTMSFALAAEAGVGDLAVGDVVEFDLRVDWESEELATVTRIAELPAETELMFEAADPAADVDG